MREILYLPENESGNPPVRIVELNKEYLVQQKTPDTASGWTLLNKAPSYIRLSDATRTAFRQANLDDPTTEHIEIELIPAQNGSGDWFVLLEDYNSRNATPAQALLGCLLLLLRDHYGVYILLNETQRTKLGMNLDNY